MKTRILSYFSRIYGILACCFLCFLYSQNAYSATALDVFDEDCINNYCHIADDLDCMMVQEGHVVLESMGPAISLTELCEQDSSYCSWYSKQHLVCFPVYGENDISVSEYYINPNADIPIINATNNGIEFYPNTGDHNQEITNISSDLLTHFYENNQDNLWLQHDLVSMCNEYETIPLDVTEARTSAEQCISEDYYKFKIFTVGSDGFDLDPNIPIYNYEFTFFVGNPERTSDSSTVMFDEINSGNDVHISEFSNFIQNDNHHFSNILAQYPYALFTTYEPTDMEDTDMNIDNFLDVYTGEYVFCVGDSLACGELSDHERFIYFGDDSLIGNLPTPYSGTYYFNPYLTEAQINNTCNTGYHVAGNSCSPITYIITYNLDGGTNYTDAPTNYTIESDTITLGIPTKDGYTFNGWIDDNNNPITSISTGSTGNITLTAQWTPNCNKITLNANGGSFPNYTHSTESVYAKTGTFNPDNVYSDSACTNQTRFVDRFGGYSGNLVYRPGYTYTGFYTSQNGDGCQPFYWQIPYYGNSGCPVTITGDTTFYAQWTPIEYTITYMDGENEITCADNNAICVNHLKASYIVLDLPLTLQNLTNKVGYTFDGWYDAATGGNKVTTIPAGSTGNKTFYARWTANTITCPAGTYLPANATQCSECPANSYCAGGTNSYSETDPQGIEQCPATYSLSAEGAKTEVECYRQCSASDVPHLKSGGTITGMFYSNETNACEPVNDESCADGYHYKEEQAGLNVDTSINGTGYAVIDNDGNKNYTYGGKTQSDYNLTANGTWGTSFSYGDITGKALCSTTIGEWATTGTPDESESGQYCWCQIDGYTPTNGSKQSLASSWVFRSDYGSASGCADYCAFYCASYVRNSAGFRAALFGSAGASPAICEADTYTITYELNGGTNNPANPATYTIESAITLNTPTRSGYTFNGWVDGNGNTITSIPLGSTGNITLTAQWTPAVIHCDAGYYLPANSTTCQPCETNGTYCDAGDYTISNQNQGILNCPIPDNITGALSINNNSRDFNDNDVYDSVEECTVLLIQTEYRDIWGQNAMEGYDSTNKLNQNIGQWYIYCRYDLGTNSYKCLPSTAYQVLCTGGYYIPETTLINNSTECDFNFDSLSDSANNKKCYNIDLANMTNPCIPAQPGYYTTGYDKIYTDELDQTDLELLNRIHGFGGVVLDNEYFDWFANEPASLDDQYAKCPQEYPNSDAGAWTINMCYRTCPSKDGYTLVSGDREYYNETNKCEYTANTYTITYELNGGTNNSANPATYTVETAITLSDPTKDGYTFAGWVDDNNNPITSISTGSTGNITLTAQWESICDEDNGEWWNGSECQYDCADGEEWMGGMCQSTCNEDNGEYWDGSECQNGCPANHYLSGNECLKCPAGTASMPGSVGVHECVIDQIFCPAYSEHFTTGPAWENHVFGYSYDFNEDGELTLDECVTTRVYGGVWYLFQFLKLSPIMPNNISFEEKIALGISYKYQNPSTQLFFTKLVFKWLNQINLMFTQHSYNVNFPFDFNTLITLANVDINDIPDIDARNRMVAGFSICRYDPNTKSYNGECTPVFQSANISDLETLDTDFTGSSDIIDMLKEEVGGNNLFSKWAIEPVANQLECDNDDPDDFCLTCPDGWNKGLLWGCVAPCDGDQVFDGSECVYCDEPGLFADSDTNKCKLCPRGSYCENGQQYSCSGVLIEGLGYTEAFQSLNESNMSTIMDFTKTNITTDEEGSSSMDECKVQLAPGTYFSVTDGLQPCMEGFYCPGGDVFFNYENMGKIQTDGFIGAESCPDGTTSPIGAKEESECIESINTINVIYDYSYTDGYGCENEEYIIGSVYNLTCIPEHPNGNDFIGWFTRPTGGSQVTQLYYTEFDPESEIILYPHWETECPTPINNNGAESFMDLSVLGLESMGIDVPKCTYAFIFGNRNIIENISDLETRIEFDDYEPNSYFNTSGNWAILCSYNSRTGLYDICTENTAVFMCSNGYYNKTGLEILNNRLHAYTMLSSAYSQKSFLSPCVEAPLCPENQHFSGNSKTCVCNDGYFDGESCQSCPFGKYSNGDGGCSYYCTHYNDHWDGEKCVCNIGYGGDRCDDYVGTECGEGGTTDGEDCECSAGYRKTEDYYDDNYGVWMPGICEQLICSEGEEWRDGACKSICDEDDGQHWNGAGCILCVDGEEWNGESCESICDEDNGEYWDGKSCESVCAEGEEWRDGACESICSDGYHYTAGSTGLNLDASINGNSSNGDSSTMTWNTTFSYGNITGKALCSPTSGGKAEVGNPDESVRGANCWCQIDGYTPVNGSKQSLSGAWVFRLHDVDNDFCADDCATNCAISLQEIDEFRATMLSSVSAPASAICEADTYTITYELNGGTNNSANPTSYTIESAITLSEPTKDGYTFNGWYTTPDFSDSAVTSILRGSTGNKTFYAQWTANTITCPAGTYLPANTTQCTECPTNSYCTGGEFTFSETNTQGVETCPTDYTSETGTSAQNQCYQTCSTSCTSPEIGTHVIPTSVVFGTETASGRNYYGSSCDAVAPVCSIQSYECDTGYHKYDPYAPTYEELITYLMDYDGTDESETKAEYPTYAAAKAYLEDDGSWGSALTSIVNPKKYGPSANENLKSKVSSADYTIDGTDYGYTRLNGNAGSKESEYGLTQGSGEWATTFNYGVIRGTAKCTATSGIYGQQGNPDATTSGEAKYCWCQGTGIKGTNGTLQSLASSWVFDNVYGSASICASRCAPDCANGVQLDDVFRAALFGSAGASPAVCEADTYTITYELNGGTNNSANPATYTIETAITLSEPTKDGYTFNGWIDDNNNPITSISTGSTGNITLTAQWTENAITCPAGTYLPQNSSECSTCPLGYACAGGDYTLGASSDQGLAACNGLDFADETGLAACKTCPIAQAYSEYVDTNTSRTPRINGYNFYSHPDECEDVNGNMGRYNCKNNISGVCYVDFNISINNGTNDYVYCDNINSDDYGTQILPNLLDGGYEDTHCRVNTIQCNTGYHIPSKLWNALPEDYESYVCNNRAYPTSSAYIWLPNVEVVKTETCVSDALDISIDEFITARSKARGRYICGDCPNGTVWDGVSQCVVPEFDIIYDYTNGGSGCPNDTYTLGTAKELTCVPSKDGYTFAGWFDSATGGNQITQITALDTGDKTFYAQWTENIISYNIFYVLDGGTNYSDAPTSYTTQDLPIILGTPTKTGYSFNGWKDANNNTITEISIGSANNITLYAKWTDTETGCQSGYEAQTTPGAGIDLDSATLASSSSGDNPTNTWVATVSGTSLSGISSCAANSTTTDTSGDILDEPINTATASNNFYCYCKLTEPAESSWVFAWKYAKATSSTGCPNKCANQCAYLMKNKNDSSGKRSTTYFRESLYSTANTGGQTVCEPISYTITYDLNAQGSIVNNENPVSYTVESLPILLNSPSRENFDFAGWTDDNGNPVTEISSGVLGNITLHASWKSYEETITYNINYDLQGGVNYEDAPITYTARDLPIILGVPTKYGYQFDGWLDNNSVITNIPIETEGDIYLTASWSPVSIACEAGTYLPAGSTECSTCKTNWYCDGGTFTFNTEENGGIISCSNLDDGSFNKSSAGARTMNACYKSCSKDCSEPPINNDHYDSFSIIPYTTNGIEHYGLNDCDAEETICKLTDIVCLNGYKLQEQMNLSEDIRPDSYQEITKNTWSATFDNNMVIQGDSICSTVTGTETGDISTITPIMNTDSTDNSYCWCKSTSPSISNWVFAFKYSKQGTCLDRCANQCGYQLKQSPSMRTSLYATPYCVLQPYSITYDMDGGNNYTDAPTSYTVQDLPISLGIPTKKGYNFNGWLDDNNNFVTEISSGVYGNITLRASWTQLPPCPEGYVYADFIVNSAIDGTSYTTNNADWSATFDYGTINGTSACSLYSEDYSVISNSANLVSGEQTGENCWCKMNQPVDSAWIYMLSLDSSSSCANECSEYCGLFAQLDSSIRTPLFAGFDNTACVPLRWNISYDIGDGTNHPSNIYSYTINDLPITIQSPTMEGATFDGWYNDAQYTGEPITQITSYDVGDKTLYAKWNFTNYSIEYVLNGGTNYADAPNTYTINDIPLSFGTPNKTNATFEGWYDNDQFTDAPISQITLSDMGDTTLYAKFSCNAGFYEDSTTKQCIEVEDGYYSEAGDNNKYSCSITTGDNTFVHSHKDTNNLLRDSINDCYKDCSKACIKPTNCSITNAATCIYDEITSYGIQDYGNSCNVVDTQCELIDFSCPTGYEKQQISSPGIVITAKEDVTYAASTSGSTWEATISGNDIIGNAVCSSTPTENGLSGEYIDSEPEVSSTISNNAYCYCKIAEPAESKWVLVWKYSKGSGCNKAETTCANQCANTLKNKNDAGGARVADYYRTALSETSATSLTSTEQCVLVACSANEYMEDNVCKPCPNDWFSPAGSIGIGSCGRILHIGDYSIYLRSEKKTTPSLNVDTNGDGVADFFGNMSPIETNINNNSNRKLKFEYNNQVMYLYDDTIKEIIE